uniref:Uncharacterized protein n=1 Tax=Caenorhabditis japonica TaxID=281687 RepID=A0A8R1HPF0_CAEJA
MQRIQSWFDQLTLGRQSRRVSRRRRHTSKQPDEHRKASSPSVMTSKKIAQPMRAASHSVVRHSRDELKPLPVNIAFPPPPTSMPPPMMASSYTSMGTNGNNMGSFPRRNRIRTNPWINESKMWESMTSSMGRSTTTFCQDSGTKKRAAQCVASPDTSMCSSGYASHDSSPDTSMVWTNCGEWPKHYDNVGNIYHELMSSSSYHSLRPTPSPKRDEQQRSESPIYAEPWTSAGPMVVRNMTYRPASPVYAQPFSDNYHRVSPRRNFKEMTDDELARDEFLHELDQQIHELQMRSEELREMVDRARLQRKEYIIPKMECTFELAI